MGDHGLRRNQKLWHGYIFCILDDSEEIYLLDKWGAVKREDVRSWVLKLQARLDMLTACTYNAYNLEHSAEMLQNSVLPELWKQVRQTLANKPMGPEVFVAIILSHQVTSASIVHKMCNELSTLQLSKNPGENVDILADQVIEKALQITGTGQEPGDLPSLVAGCFLDACSPQFQLSANILFDMADSGDELFADWQETIVEPLCYKYVSLKQKDLWPASQKQTELQSLKVEVKALKKTVEDKKGENKGADNGQSRQAC